MRFSVLASGSKANCTFVEAGGKRFLIDCGLSGKQAEIRLRRLGVDPAQLDGIFVTHEHGDHIQGVGVLSRRYNLPIFANEGTAVHIKKPYALETFQTGRTVEFGGCTIRPFSVVHDASDPVGFCVESKGLRFTQATDLGKATPVVKEYLRFAHAVVLESNYDPHLLNTCHYPWQTKQRIQSTHGHLSNGESAQLLSEVWQPDLQHVVLAHLSENSNDPETAARQHKKRVAVTQCAHFLIGSQLQETPLIRVGEASLDSGTSIQVA